MLFWTSTGDGRSGDGRSRCDGGSRRASRIDHSGYSACCTCAGESSVSEPGEVVALVLVALVQVRMVLVLSHTLVIVPTALVTLVLVALVL
eukprot:3640099-Pyramimonas_sp.AAC.1